MVGQQQQGANSWFPQNTRSSHASSAAWETTNSPPFTFGKKEEGQQNASYSFGTKPVQDTKPATTTTAQVNHPQQQQLQQQHRENGVGATSNNQAPTQRQTPVKTQTAHATTTTRNNTANNANPTSHASASVPAPAAASAAAPPPVSPSKMDEIIRKAQTIKLGGSEASPQKSVSGNMPKKTYVVPETANYAAKVASAKPVSNGVPQTGNSSSSSSGISSTTPSVAPEKEKDALPSSSSSSTLSTTVTKRAPDIPTEKFKQAETWVSEPKNSFALSELDNSIRLEKSPSFSLKPVNIQELSTFLSFEQAREYFPWIGIYHPEGKLLHPSLPYLAVVFNEFGYWEKEHVLLLASNDELSEQMNWEIRVAMLFNKDSGSRHELHKALESIPRDEAMMIIALRTAKSAQEIVLAPSPDSDIADVNMKLTVEKIYEWARSEAEIVAANVEKARARCEQISALLEIAGLSPKEFWNRANSDDKQLLSDLVKARVLLWQLDNLLVYVSPYTSLIHVKSTRWEPSYHEKHPYHPLVDFVPSIQEYQSKLLDIGVSNNRQYENLQKFFHQLAIEVDVEGNPRTLIFNSLERPEDYIPFELFFTHHQRGQAINHMRSVTGFGRSFHFVAPPAAINKSKTYYSLEGIITYKSLWYHTSKYQADTMTISLSKFADYLSPASKAPPISTHSPRRLKDSK